MATPTYRTVDELTPAHWSEQTIEANGIPQHFLRTGGDKPPLLLLHGFQMEGVTWLRLAKVLESDYDVIMPDARGHGRSGGGDAYSTPAMVEDVAALIVALELDRPPIIGHSMGADTAGRLARAYPERTGALVLIDPALKPVNPGLWMESEGYKAWYRDWLEYVEGLRVLDHSERVAATLERQTPGISPREEEDFVTHIEALRHLDLGLLETVTTMNEGADALMEVLAQVETPMLVMLTQPPAGGYSIGHRAAERDELQGRLRNGEVVLYEDTGHFIHSERPDEFVDRVKRFFAENERGH